MRKIYSILETTKKLRIYSLAIFLLCFVMYGCFKLKLIEHPSTTTTNSSFDVKFTFEPDGPDETPARGMFGVLLPKGWRVQDYTDYVVTFDGLPNTTGKFSYSQYYTDHLEREYSAPEGFYWWGGRTIDKLQLKISGNTAKEFSYTFQIYTDGQTGDFELRYIVGNDANGYDKNVDITRTISVTAGSRIPMQKTANWELLTPEGSGNDDKWNENVKFYSDKDYDGFFTRWTGWTGGDIAWSAGLGDGRSIWVFGDSHTGIVTSDRTRQSENSQFERNFLMLQDGEDFSAFRLLNEGEPPHIREVLIPTDDNGNNMGKHDEWYWPAGSTIYYRDGVPELQMVLSRVRNNGQGGMWGMDGVSADVAVFSLPDLKLQEIKKYRHRQVNAEKDGNRYSIGYSGYVFRDDDGVVYIYGSGDVEGICARSGFVARVTNGDLTGDWEFYNAQTQSWSTDTSWQNDFGNWRGAAMADNPIFVFKDGSKYYGITQPGACFSRKIELFEADSPYGPFRNSKVIGVLPAAISDDNPYFCSLLAIHPQLSKNGELLFSVSKNSQDGAGPPWYGVPGNADSYLPYFFRVKNWRNKLDISERMDATDNKGILTAEDDENIEYLTDNDEKTIYSTANNSTWIQYDSPSPINLRRYTITSAEDAPEKDPLHWKILASNDGTNWTVIDERYYAEFDERQQTISYNVAIEGEFTYYRFEILASKGGSGLQIAEWQMLGKFEYEKGTVAELEQVTVNGNPVTIEDVMTINISSSDESDFLISLKTKDYGVLEGSREFTSTMDKAGIKKYNIKVTAEDESSEKVYQLILNRWFAFDDVIKVKWDNTLMLYLNRLEEYTINGYRWYENNSAISGATGKSYSVGPKKTDLLNANSSYHVAFTTPDGVIRSDAKQITLKSMDVVAYPNPVASNEPLTVVADIEDELLIGASIEVFNIQGNKVNTTKVQGRSTMVNMPSASGVYMLKFKSNGFDKALKVVVK